MNLSVFKIGEGNIALRFVISIDLDFYLFQIDIQSYEELPVYIKSSKKEFLQLLVSSVCKKLGIPIKEVFAFKKLPEKGFTDTFYEFIGHNNTNPYGHSFGWKYFIETKLYNIYKYYEIKESGVRIFTSTDRIEHKLILDHFGDMIDCMEEQGFFPGVGFLFEPKFSLIDRLTNQILKR